jgi:hypothetical protein
MADDAENYASQIAELRAERKQAEARERLKVVEDNYRTALEWRSEAEESGDLTAWRDSDQWAESLEKEYAELLPKEPQRPSWMTAENAEYARRCADLNTPLNDAKFQQFVMTAERAGINLSDHAQFKEALEKFVSPGAFDQQGRLIPNTEGPIVPPEYQPMPDREEAFRIANNSKYGCKPEDFVRGERERDKRKAAGFYPDKG